METKLDWLSVLAPSILSVQIGLPDDTFMEEILLGTHSIAASSLNICHKQTLNAVCLYENQHRDDPVVREQNLQHHS